MRELDRACLLIESSVGAESPLCRGAERLRERLQQKRLQIAILGQFKRGKSTFINALLGAPILPTAVVPLTAVPTFISWRQTPLIRVEYSNGKAAEHFEASEAVAIEDVLSRFVTEEANPRNRLRVERVDLFYPAAILGDGTVLIDTPGIGSTLAHNTEAAVRVLPECDGSLFIVSSDPPLTEMELAYLHQLKPRIGHTFFVINKIDYLTFQERGCVADFMRKVLMEESLIDPEAPIFGVSARLALMARQSHDEEALRKSGIQEIEGALVRYLATEKTRALDEAIRLKAAEIVGQARAEVELGLRALSMPLEKLEQKSSEFSRALHSIETERLTVGDLLAGDRRRLVDELETRIKALRQTASSSLKRVIDECHVEGLSSWEERVKSGVASATEELFNAASDEFIGAFSARADAVLSDRRQRINALVNDVRQTAAEMFDVAFAPEQEPEAFRLAREPYWVTERLAATLIPDVSTVIDRFLPTSLWLSRRRRRIVTETGELIIRNAESLRWAVLRGLDETFRAATSQLEERLSDAKSATKGVIEDAVKRRHDRSFGAKAELDRLEQCSERLKAAQAEFLTLADIRAPAVCRLSRN